ncbi:MAG: hypothetical protein N2C14_16820 [Planctomycetales bacterium]
MTSSNRGEAGAAISNSTVKSLRGRLRKLERNQRSSSRTEDRELISTGVENLDQLLPEGGFLRGSLVEWLSVGAGAGAVTLALRGVREACRQGAVPAFIDRAGELYPPALAGLGIDLDRAILVRPTKERDESWALEQALRCPGVGAVLACKPPLNDRVFRRLQLAAETGGGLGVLIRPATVRQEPSWASVRVLVESMPCLEQPNADGEGIRVERRLRLTVLRCKGGADGGVLELGVNDETGDVRVVAELADPTIVRPSTGA